MPGQTDVTELLQEASDGDTVAFDKLYGLVYDELWSIARSVRRGSPQETLNTTSLVHEAYFKLVRTPGKLEWANRAHFFAVAARAMRQVLVNAARDRVAQKRGGQKIQITLDEQAIGPMVEPAEFLSLHDALEKLEVINQRQARIIECRFFGGLSVKETAAALDVSERTIKRDWRFARAWLGMQLEG